jgi:hypothetical protein
MSIFSKLLKRGPDEGGSPAEPAEPATAARPAPAAEPAPAPAPARPAAAPRDPARAARPSAAPATPPASTAAKAGATRSYNAAAPPPAAAGKSAPPAGAAPAAAKPAAARPAAANAAAKGGGAAAARAAGAEAAAKSAAPAPAANGAPTNGVHADAQAASGSLDQAFERLFEAQKAAAPAAPANGVSTVSDLKAVMATFEDLAVGHSAQVRSLMMEVRWGEAQTSWFELARPSLKSLRSMAGQVGHDALTAALDGFGAAIDEALAPGAPPTIAPAMRDKLLGAYAPLVAALPTAFELEGARDRREPVVVRALLAQVPDLEPLMIDKLMAAGLVKLETLFQARADEIAVVSGLPAEIATAIVARVQDWRRATPAALATPDPTAAARELAALVGALETQHTAFEDAARGWSEADREAKRRLRREREVTSLQVTVLLARMGEVDLAIELERRSFARRLEDLGRLVARLAPLLAAAPPPAASGQVRKIDSDRGADARAAH